MKTRAILFVGMFVVMTTAAAVHQHRSSNDRATSSSDDLRWEYLVVAGGSTNLTSMSSGEFSSMKKAPDGSFTREAYPFERNMDKVGEKGWELVAVSGSPQDPTLYFKRLKH
jgi:hypothetical protein